MSKKADTTTNRIPPPIDGADAIRHILRSPKQGEPLDQWKGLVAPVGSGILIDFGLYDEHFGDGASKRDDKLINATLDTISRLGVKLTYTETGLKETADEINALIAAAEATGIGENFREMFEEAATTVINHDDPASLIEPEIRRLGFGGDTKPPVITYLAMTTRLLRVQDRLGHILLKGAASTGKNAAVNAAKALIPSVGWVSIDAGSPRALIYLQDTISHRTLIYGEADSIPDGEEAGSASSAIRAMLEENQMTYDVVEQDKATNKWVTNKRVNPGPTVLVTTSVRPLGPQMMSRLFVVDVADSKTQREASLRAMAETEINGSVTADEALYAYQGYLQSKAPWNVVVPYAGWLAEHLSATAQNSRVNRDFRRILAFIKAVAILRNQHRETDDKGRLMATVEDYTFVYDLLRSVYSASATGVSEDIRQIIKTVANLKATGHQSVNVADLHRAMPDKPRRTIQYHVQRLTKPGSDGYLVNTSLVQGRYNLEVGDPLPDRAGLPHPSLFGQPPRPHTPEPIQDGSPVIHDDEYYTELASLWEAEELVA